MDSSRMPASAQRTTYNIALCNTLLWHVLSTMATARVCSFNHAWENSMYHAANHLVVSPGFPCLMLLPLHSPTHAQLAVCHPCPVRLPPCSPPQDEAEPCVHMGQAGAVGQICAVSYRGRIGLLP